MLLTINKDYPQKRKIEEVAGLMADDGVVVLPTDTTFCYCCDLFSKKAVDKIYALKKLGPKKPLSILCSDLKHISQFALVTNGAFRMMKSCLPGPYTFILPAGRQTPRSALTNRKTIGLRVPDSRICQEVIRHLGNPVLATTVRLPGQEEILTGAQEIHRIMNGQVSAVVDHGFLMPEQSTVISMTGDQPELIRKGKGEVGRLFEA